ncbi:MAG TPA: glycine cleavage system aminomethyltransferase GcvT [Candidatus Limnocylindrales bacterium]|nr:glycine cleavage system aminomethyltransferase GcvT [Candidatus Limnocylindrales bacterium]
MGLNRTPLFTAHQQLGAKLIDFGGWEMPVQYTSIVEEHLAVRQAAGIFDISHMGEVTVSAAAAADFLNRTLTNDVRKLASGQGQYTLMCNERGGAIDDLYVYRLCDEVYLLIVNASRVKADVAWLQSRAATFPQRSGLQLTDASHNYAALAVQGPRVKEFINDCVKGASISAARVERATDLRKNQIGEFHFEHGGVLVSRTGYTGEDGFEIIGSDKAIQQVWDKILAAGRSFGLKPCGLGARDTLRTEVCYPLYGHELDENTTPMEAGLGFFVSLDKGDFIGRAILAEQKAKGTGRKLAAFKMSGKSAPPRPHYPIWANGVRVGDVTSGTQSPSLGIGIGMGYVPPGLAKPGTEIEIEIRGKRSPALVVARPIYRRS